MEPDSFWNFLIKTLGLADFKPSKLSFYAI